MKIGKLPESILKRSVLKQIEKSDRKEVVSGAAVGADCALLAFEGGLTAACVQESTLAGASDVYRLIHRVANSLACGGAAPTAVLIGLLLSEDTEEEELQALMEAARSVCRELDMAIVGGHTSVAADVTRPHMTVTGLGAWESSKGVGTQGHFLPGGARPGQDIVISKWVGLEGTAVLAAAFEKQLSERYPNRLIQEALSFHRYQSVLSEARAALAFGVSALHDVSEGGIFRALWEVAESAGLGLRVDLKKIPIRQETVEVCEFFQVNPYELLSGGSLIMITDRGEELVEALEQLQIPAHVAGQITAGKDRIVVNEEETRYLDRPRTEEIYKVL